MPSHRLLAAALALDTFTAGELASTSGVPLNTARCDLTRHRDLFERVDVVASGRRGRPPQRYRLHDPDAVHATLAAARRDATPRAAVERPDGAEDWRLPVVPVASSDADDRRLALELAEHALRRALLSDDPEDCQDLARTATTTADRLLDAGAGLDADVERRAGAVRAFARYLQRDAHPRHAQELSAAAAGAIAALACVPGLGIGLLLTALVELAQRAHALPPIAVVAQLGREPGDVLPGLHATGWHRRPLAGECLWSPAWAEALVEPRLLAGVVIGDDRQDEQELTQLIDELQSWNLPTVVACSPDAIALQRRVFALGATPIAAVDAEAAVSWFCHRLTDHAPSAAAAAVQPALAHS